MKLIMNKIEIYKCRTLKETYLCTNAFVKDCWHPLLLVLSVALTPLCLVQTFCGGIFADIFPVDVSKESLMLFGMDVLWTLMMYFFADIYMIMVVYGMMNIYCYGDAGDRGKFSDFNKITFRQFWTSQETQFNAIGKILGSLTLLGVVLAVIVCALGIVTGIISATVSISENVLAIIVSLFVCMLVLAMPLWILAIPAYSLDKLDFYAGIKRALVYGFTTWRGITVILLTYMIADIVVSIPLEFIPFPIGTFLNTYMSYVLQFLLLVVLGFQYGHAKAKRRGS